MYLAFRWLVSLTLLMWLAMCWLDLHVKHNVLLEMNNTGIPSRLKLGSMQDKPKLKIVKDHFPDQEIFDVYENSEGLFYITFTTGFLIAVLYHKNQDILKNINEKYRFLNLTTFHISLYFENAALKLRAAILQFLRRTWGETLSPGWNNIVIKMKKGKCKLCDYLSVISKAITNYRNIQLTLSNKLLQIREEKHNLELKTLSKNRLLQQIHDTQKQMRENKLNYYNFHRLYVITHQENIYLKARLVKLKKEKTETEKGLMELIKEVYKSRNNDLKTYCTRFIVKTRENLIRCGSDVCEELKQFRTNFGSQQIFDETHASNILSICSNGPMLRKSLRKLQKTSTDAVSIQSESLKLIGQPADVVWTVRDGDGVIKKLYQCNYDPNLESGHTTQRIRQYSVYYDNDYLVDFSNFNSDFNHAHVSLFRPVIHHNIVTGSQAFQNFLKNNNIIVSSESLQTLRRRTP